MDDWFSVIDARCELSAGAVQGLRDVGFIVIPGPVAQDRLAQFAEAYDSAVVCAAADDVCSVNAPENCEMIWVACWM